MLFRSIAEEYGLADRASIYRHAHALGLFPKRQRNIPHSGSSGTENVLNDAVAKPLKEESSTKMLVEESGDLPKRLPGLR